MQTESSAGSERSKSLITVNIETPKDEKTINIHKMATIKEFKQVISGELNGIPVEQLCLIFSGRMLKDHDNLERSSIKDNVTVHLVILHNLVPS